MSRNKDETGSAKDERAARLAEALRENLRRRKAQARARRGGEAVGGERGADIPASGHEAGTDKN